MLNELLFSDLLLLFVSINGIHMSNNNKNKAAADRLFTLTERVFKRMFVNVHFM